MFIWLVVCQLHCSKNYEQVLIKFKMTNYPYFSDDPVHTDRDLGVFNPDPKL